MSNTNIHPLIQGIIDNVFPTETAADKQIKEIAATIAADLRPPGKKNIEEWEEYGISVALELINHLKKLDAAEKQAANYLHDREINNPRTGEPYK